MSTPPNVAAMREALRTHRLERGLSYDKLSREIGITHVAVMNFIKGQTEPLETTIYRVNQYLQRAGVRVAA